MGIYFGEVGNCFWAANGGNATDAEWEACWDGNTHFYKRLIASGQSGCGITFTWKADAPNAQQRKRLAENIESGPLVAHALVTDSRAIIMVLTALRWLQKKPAYHDGAFADPEAGLDWLNQHFPIDRAAIVAAVLREVPAGQRDPSLSYLYKQYARGA